MGQLIPVELEDGTIIHVVPFKIKNTEFAFVHTNHLLLLLAPRYLNPLTVKIQSALALVESNDRHILHQRESPLRSLALR
jgi:hypothetical protein